MQTDGANNYDCTAFMSSVQAVFSAAGLRLVRHVITEVGDGKNLEDQDFQVAQQDMNHARFGGMDLLNAQNIIDALATGKALGIINVGMDLPWAPHFGIVLKLCKALQQVQHRAGELHQHYVVGRRA